MTLKRITRKFYPRAPEVSVGQYIPKVRGAVPEIPMRVPPWSSEYEGTDYTDSNSHSHTLLTGGRRGTPGVITDAGGGPTRLPTRIHFASHACKRFALPHQGLMPYIEVDGRLAIMESQIDSNYFNDATGTGIEFPDLPSGGSEPYGYAFYPIPCITIEEAPANNADNGKAALDIANDTSYARLDYDAGYHYLWARLPSIATVGDVLDANYYIFYSSVGSMANVVFRLVDAAAATSTHVGLAGSANPTFDYHGPDPATFGPTEPWAYGQIKMEVYFTGTPTGVSLKIYGLGVVVQFRPKREIVASTWVNRDPELGSEFYASYFSRQQRDLIRAGNPVPTQVPIISPRGVGSSWFATLEGYADSGGTYTGSGTDLIERAPDIAHHVLVVDGGETSGNVTTAASTFGSFVDARANLKTWRQSTMKHALVLTQPERVVRILDRLCNDAGIWIYLSEFDDKWKCIVWDAGVAVDYTPKLTVRDIAAPGLRLRPTANTRRAAGVEVKYGYDYFRERDTQETSIGVDKSVAPHKYRSLRDQQFTIIDSGDERNDKIDFTSSAGTFAATISAGAKTPATMMADVKTALTAQWNPATGAWVTCHGTTIVTGINDRWTVQENEGAQDIVIAVCLPGTYATMEALATAWQTALNNVSDSFTVTYSRTTQFFTVARAGNTFRIYVGGGVYADYTGNFTLGMNFATTAYAASQVSYYQVEEERFIIGNTYGAFDLKWETGTNGTNGNNINAANVLGYDAARDGLDYSLASPTRRLAAVCPTNTREQIVGGDTAATSPFRIAGRTIYDDDTAREVRDRAADLLLPDRPEVQIPLLWNPDLERGRVLEFDSSPDELWPYAVEGSDGSWAGKKFQVIDKVQHLAGSYMTEVTAVEIS